MNLSRYFFAVALLVIFGAESAAYHAPSVNRKKTTPMVNVEGEARTWTDELGRTIQARLVAFSVNDETIKIIRLPDNNEFEISKRMLSEKDQVYVKYESIKIRLQDLMEKISVEVVDEFGEKLDADISVYAGSTEIANAAHRKSAEKFDIPLNNPEFLTTTDVDDLLNGTQNKLTVIISAPNYQTEVVKNVYGRSKRDISMSVVLRKTPVAYGNPVIYPSMAIATPLPFYDFGAIPVQGAYGLGGEVVSQSYGSSGLVSAGVSSVGSVSLCCASTNHVSCPQSTVFFSPSSFPSYPACSSSCCQPVQVGPVRRIIYRLRSLGDH